MRSRRRRKPFKMGPKYKYSYFISSANKLRKDDEVEIDEIAELF